MDGSWTTIYSQTITADVSATPVSIPLTTTTTQLSFQVENHAAGEMSWHTFDDVLVEGTYQAYAPDDLEVEFDTWWELEDGYDYVYLEVVDGCDPLFASEWIEVFNFTNNSYANTTYIPDGDGWIHFVIDLEPYITGDNFTLRFRLDSDANTEARGFIVDNLQINDGIFGPDPMNNMSNWCVGCSSIGDFWTDWCIDIPDLLIDNALIWETEINDAYEAYLIVNHTYEFSNIIDIFKDNDLGWEKYWETGNWTNISYDPGATNWTWLSGAGTIAWWSLCGAGFYDSSIESIPLDFTQMPPGLPATLRVRHGGHVGDDTLGIGAESQIWINTYDGGGSYSGSLLIKDYYEDQGAWTYFDDTGGFHWAEFEFDPYDADLVDNDDARIEFYIYGDGDSLGGWQILQLTLRGATEPAHGFIEISTDGGVTWHILDEFIGSTFGEDDVDQYDITPYVGNDILVRFRVEGSEDSVDDRFWCLNDVYIAGKTDETAPTSTATMSGTMKESGWYTTGVKVTITATDEGAGMGEIHYILDGTENVVSGSKAEFTVSGNGEHNIQFWAVDKMGNVEAKHTIPTFRIDSGSAPSVAITAPEPGLYLFGNKLLSASKVIIIGAFTVEATASDAESGIYRVQFYLDGDLISEDTEMPFNAYIAEKHMGAGTIKVVAEDFAQNTAEDTLDITYYKFL
jgi:hypothetical protein